VTVPLPAEVVGAVELLEAAVERLEAGKGTITFVAGDGHLSASVLARPNLAKPLAAWLRAEASVAARAAELWSQVRKLPFREVEPAALEVARVVVGGSGAGSAGEGSGGDASGRAWKAPLADLGVPDAAPEGSGSVYGPQGAAGGGPA
jgi:hypothetical protein